MPTPSYLDSSLQDAGEADKDRHTPGSSCSPHRKYENKELVPIEEFTRTPGMAKGQKPRTAMPPAIKQAAAGATVLRLLSLLKGGRSGEYYARGQAAHVASLMPGSTMTPKDVNAAYKPYRDEVGKVMGTWTGVGAAGYGAHKAYDKAHAQSAWERMVAKAKTAYDEIVG